MKAGLTLLSHISVPIKLWTTTFNTTVFLINHLPTSILGYKSPHEVVFGYTPTYDSFYEFLGALVTHYLHHLVDQNWALS